jgi:DNA-binding transcriptional regulator YiaG
VTALSLANTRAHSRLTAEYSYAYYARVMSNIAHIRTKVFGMTQEAFARMAGVSQATVSRWETGELTPSLESLQRIRSVAKAKKKRWSDKWFFEVHGPANGEAA